jgi:hypothetical protein
MATNENGNLVDDKGNVAVDFVWGNFPLQPNDVREENGGELLDATLDNHSIAYEGWNGYPLFNPDLDGDGIIDGSAGPEGAGYIVVPSVIGSTTAVATNVLEDDGLVVTVGTAATNAKKDITRINATSATVAVVYTTSASTAYPVGTKVVIAAGTAAEADPVGVPAALVGTWTVTAAASGNITIAGTGFTVADTTGINSTGNINGLAGTIKTQSVAAGTDEVEVGDAISIVAYAAAS